MKKIFAIFLVLFLIGTASATDKTVGVEALRDIECSKVVIGIDNHKVYTGLSFETGCKLFIGTNLGSAYTLVDKDLGSRLLFRASIYVGYRIKNHRIIVVADHISNADLAERNPGLDTLGIRYGYVF